MEPYYTDGTVTLYHGDMRKVLPALGVKADCIIADPPYGETSLTWDRWPEQWLNTTAEVTNSLWCFGSMRMLMTRRDDFNAWKLSQDLIWEKANGTGFSRDRFKRVHEIVTHWYRGKWADIHHEVPLTDYSGPDRSVQGTGSVTPHTGVIGTHKYTDNGTRLTRSIVRANSVRFKRRHPTEKPTAILQPLIEYACPPGGLVIDPFAGSGSTLDTAREIGRRSIGIEADEQYIEAAAKRLSR